MNIAASPNTSLAFPIEDVQGRADTRRIPINKVGIKEISYPVRVKDRARGEQHTVATFNMYVNLPHDFKGTHMSRLVEILHHEREISVESFDFGECRDGSTDVWLKMMVPTTSLCPCSKKISDYGAHNQRSHITLTAKLSEHMWLEELIDIAESEASCEVYGILKRPDEKFVTERAYDNPKFVEDTVRDVAVALNKDGRVRAYVVEAENVESIHNHSAYAMIEHDKEAWGPGAEASAGDPLRALQAATCAPNHPP